MVILVLLQGLYQIRKLILQDYILLRLSLDFFYFIHPFQKIFIIFITFNSMTYNVSRIMNYKFKINFVLHAIILSLKKY